MSWPRWPTAAWCGAISDKPIDPALLETLCAVALSAPSKSDLQQADIVIVTDKAQRAELEALIPGNPWAKAGPALLVFCGNNRRHRLLFEWRGRPFVNDSSRPVLQCGGRCRHRAGDLHRGRRPGRPRHLPDQPASATMPAKVSELLGLPEHVFPVAGLGIGWPSFEG